MDSEHPVSTAMRLAIEARESIERANATDRAALEHDPINRPEHYTSHPSGVECIAITEHMNFCIGNAIKYLWRAGLKDGTSALEDLQKSRWYVSREIERLGAAPEKRA